MKRILILGGGVGGTLTANLLVRKLRRQVKAGEVTITRRRPDRPAHVPAGVHVHRDGRRAGRAASSGPSAACSTSGSTWSSATSTRIDEPTRTSSTSQTASRLAYDQLVARHGLADRARSDRALRHGGPPFLHAPRRPSNSAAALDAFAGGRIVIGIAGMPYKCPPAPLEVAFLIEAELRQRGLRDASELHFCSPIGRAFTIESVSEMATPILEREGDRAPHVLQRRGDRSASARSSRASRAKSCPTTCSSSSRRTRASSS